MKPINIINNIHESDEYEDDEKALDPFGHEYADVETVCSLLAKKFGIDSEEKVKNLLDYLNDRDWFEDYYEAAYWNDLYSDLKEDE